jgi:DNA mismatch repair protein MutS
VLDHLREEKAIEAKGGSSGEPVQAVFDLGSGQFAAGGRDVGRADGGDGGDAGASGRTSDTADAPALDPETDAVLDELRATDVNGTSPLELMSRVQEWQRRLDDD